MSLQFEDVVEGNKPANYGKQEAPLHGYTKKEAVQAIQPTDVLEEQTWDEFRTPFISRLSIFLLKKSYNVINVGYLLGGLIAVQQPPTGWMRKRALAKNAIAETVLTLGHSSLKNLRNLV